MGLILNGNAPSKMLYNGAEVSLYFNGSKIWPESSPTPILPAYTLRLKYEDDVTPNFTKGTAVQVSTSPNIWDLTYINNDWSSLLSDHRTLLEVIAVGDTSNVTNMNYMFRTCIKLKSVPLFNTLNVTVTKEMFYACFELTSVPAFNLSSVTSIDGMFYACYVLTTIPLFNMTTLFSMSYAFSQCTSLTSIPLLNTSTVWNMDTAFFNCTSLTSVPLLNTSSVTRMQSIFEGCTNVQSGALALYQQVSTQTTPPTKYSKAFMNCGSNTTTGAAELAQIPTSWGGTMS